MIDFKKKSMNYFLIALPSSLKSRLQPLEFFFHEFQALRLQSTKNYEFYSGLESRSRESGVGSRESVDFLG